MGEAALKDVWFVEEEAVDDAEMEAIDIAMSQVSGLFIDCWWRNALGVIISCCIERNTNSTPSLLFIVAIAHTHHQTHRPPPPCAGKPAELFAATQGQLARFNARMCAAAGARAANPTRLCVLAPLVLEHRFDSPRVLSGITPHTVGCQEQSFLPLLAPQSTQHRF